MGRDLVRLRGLNEKAPGVQPQKVIFTSAVAANARETEVAKEFITYLTTPAAVVVIKAKGMNPG